MKKVININFKGRVIPIEETAFEQLQKYTESLRRYFANEEGRDEIINDIEDRIAELFDEELKKGATCITDASVASITASMGSVEDFEQMDGEPSSAGNASANTGSASYSSTDEPRGSINRNINDKVLGGVCSGIAHYLKIDPTIVRILFALITLGGFGAGIIIYLILWAILPVRNLTTNVKKRLFRDPDDKVIAGVASGVAKYFNIPVWVPRIVFVLPLIFGAIPSILDFNPGPFFFTSGFGGTLFLTYVVLWIVLPKASTATDKLQMRGEKIDVGSISKAVKEDLKKMGDDVKVSAQGASEELKANAKQFSEEIKEGAQKLSTGISESAQRLSEEVKERSQSFATEIKPVAQSAGNGIGNAIGILFKAFFLFIAGCIAFGLLMALFGISIGGIVAWPLKDFFFEGAAQNFSVWGTLIFFLLVPAVAFFVWIIRKIFSIKSKNSYLGYVFGGLWIIGWVSVIMLISSISRNFRNRDTVEQTVAISQPVNKKMLVTVTEPEVRYSGNYWWMDDDADGWDITDDTLKLSTVNLRIEQSTNSDYNVKIVRRSYGQSKRDAKDKAGKIYYNTAYRDSVLDLGSYMAIAKNDKFRGQQVEVVVAVPVGSKIRFDRSVERKLNPVRYRFNHRNRWNRFDEDWDMDIYTDFDYSTGVDYIMTADGLRRADGKDNDKYEYNKNEEGDSEDVKEEMKEIERQKEELRRREEELKNQQQQQQNDTNRYRYQPGNQKAPEKTSKQIAETDDNDEPIMKPITISAL